MTMSSYIQLTGAFPGLEFGIHSRFLVMRRCRTLTVVCAPGLKASRCPREMPAAAVPSFSSSKGGGYAANLNRKMVADKADVKKAMETGIAQIADARSFGRWSGEEDEPRRGLLSGHIPGSLSMPFTYFTKSGDNTSMRTPTEIRDVFKDAGLIFGANTISTCGSGMTAAYAVLGMAMIGKDITTMPIYDGSWTEWGGAEDTPKGGLNFDKNFGKEST